MPTPFESAQLILSLYELRREETMRKARDFWFGFDPQTFEDYMNTMGGPQGVYVRMVLSYWDMAASLVENGAIDRKMFADANGEFLPVFGKVEHLLPKIREFFQNPDFAIHLERVALSVPNARERIDTVLARIRSMAAARAAANGN